MQTDTKSSPPYALAEGEGQALRFLGAATWVKATREQTGGALGLIEQVTPAGSASPWHVYRNEDEAFYVVEGELTFRCGDQTMEVEAGTWVWGPRGVPHGFRVRGATPARMLLLTPPAGFEQFVVEMGELVAEGPAPPAGPPDMEKLVALSAKYGIDILGPLPE